MMIWKVLKILSNYSQFALINRSVISLNAARSISAVGRAGEQRDFVKTSALLPFMLMRELYEVCIYSI